MTQFDTVLSIGWIFLIASWIPSGWYPKRIRPTSERESHLIKMLLAGIALGMHIANGIYQWT